MFMLNNYAASRPAESSTAPGDAEEDDLGSAEPLTWGVSFAEIQRLTEQDIQWYAIWKDDRVELQAKVRLNNLKGHRRDLRFKEVSLREGDNITYDPTLPLLALSVEDRVFEGVSSVATLYNIKKNAIDAFGGKFLIPIRSEISNTKVLRTIYLNRASGAWEPDPVEGLTYGTALEDLKRVARRAGFIDNVTFTAFRRMQINITNTSSHTEADKKIAYGHAPGSLTDQRY